MRLVYQRGEFTADDTVIVAQCLQAFSIGLVFNGWMLILNRSFYAVQTNWVPTGIALGAVALNAVLDTVFYRLRDLGNPARDVDGERRRGGRAPRDDAPPDRARARRSHARRGRASRGRRGGRCRARIRDLVRPRRSARPRASGPDRFARRGVRASAGSCTSGSLGRSGCASSRRCYCCEPGATIPRRSA